MSAASVPKPLPLQLGSRENDNHGHRVPGPRAGTARAISFNPHSPAKSENIAPILQMRGRGT